MPLKRDPKHEFYDTSKKHTKIQLSLPVTSWPMPIGIYIASRHQRQYQQCPGPLDGGAGFDAGACLVASLTSAGNTSCSHSPMRSAVQWFSPRLDNLIRVSPFRFSPSIEHLWCRTALLMEGAFRFLELDLPSPLSSPSSSTLSSK